MCGRVSLCVCNMYLKRINISYILGKFCRNCDYKSGLAACVLAGQSWIMVGEGMRRLDEIFVQGKLDLNYVCVGLETALLAQVNICRLFTSIPMVNTLF